MLALQELKPHYFGNGGDRTKKNTPEQVLCKELGIELVWKVGGSKKARSSSQLVEDIVDKFDPRNEYGLWSGDYLY